MSVEAQTVIRDPTLFRAVTFVGWTSREPKAVSADRLRLLCETLERLGWMPEGTSFPSRDEIARFQLRLWAPQTQPATSSGGRTWRLHRFGQSIHEEIVVLLGLGQDGTGSATGWEEWSDSAAAHWDRAFGSSEWHQEVVLPGSTGETNRGRPEVLGQAWVWTGEWDITPEEGWELFARAHYRSDSVVVFPWGVLGYQPNTTDGLPRFDLHTTDDERDKVGRDQYLYNDLPILLSVFLKIDQSNRRRFEEHLSPRLDELDHHIVKLCEPHNLLDGNLTLGEMEDTVRELTADLYRFQRDMADLEGRALNVKIARDTIAGTFSSSSISQVSMPALAGRVERLGVQMSRDLEDYKTTAELGQNALESIGILVDIVNTKGEQRITVIGIILGVCLGIGQLLDPSWPWTYRLYISLVPGLVLGGIYRLLVNWGIQRLVGSHKRRALQQHVSPGDLPHRVPGTAEFRGHHT